MTEIEHPDPTQSDDAAGPSEVDGWRGPLTTFLAAVAAISLVLAVTGSWMRTTVMNTDAWVDAMAPLPENEEFRGLVATAVTDEVLGLIDLNDVLNDEIGPVAALLAGPIEDTTAKFVERSTEEAIESPAFETIWTAVNRIAHEGAVRVLRGEADNLTTVDGKVVIDVVPIINLVVTDVSNNSGELFGLDVGLPEITADQVDQATAMLSGALDVELPADFGQIPLFDEAAVEQVQQPVRLIDQGLIALWVIFALSFVGALVSSLNRRRTVAVLGVGTAVAATFVWLIRSPIEAGIIGEVKSAAGKQAATIVIETVLWRGLGRLVVLLLIASLLAAFVAFVAGPSTTAVSIRHTVGALFRGDRASQTPVSRFLRNHASGFRVAGALIALLGMLSLPRLTWGWFFVISIVLAAYELAWHFIPPEEGLADEPESSAPLASSPG